MYKKYTTPFPYCWMRGSRKTSWDCAANKNHFFVFSFFFLSIFPSFSFLYYHSPVICLAKKVKHFGAFFQDFKHYFFSEWLLKAQMQTMPSSPLVKICAASGEKRITRRARPEEWTKLQS